MADDPKKRVPRGRINRLSKMVGMGARVSRDLVSSRVKKMLGGEGDPKVDAARRVLDTLGEMKGAALKLGQTLSLGSGQLPPEVRQVVARLFSQAPSIDYSEIAGQIQRELGADPHEIFTSFAEEPFAAASLGQVHRATLPTGELVAVKVQYPGVEDALDEDLRNAASVVKTLGVGSTLLDGRDYFEELRAELSAELDYRRELELLEAFRRYLEPWPDLVVPQSHAEFSSAKVLVLELLEGPTLHEYCKHTSEHPADERFRVGLQLCRAIYGPFFRHRVIHGDTHPGNFIVRADGTLGVLDFGSIKYVSEPFWNCYRTLLDTRVRKEDVGLVNILRSAGFTITLNERKAERLLWNIVEIVERPLHGPYDFGDDRMVEDLKKLGLKYPTEFLRIRPPPEAILFYRAVAGLAYNLRHLAAAGDFRPLFEELIGQADLALDAALH